jgi:phosphoribosylformylglycinamidine cyclo-ligase
LKLAFVLDKHDTVGIDCVAMCVNDIACTGAEPLFFLDYIACGKNVPEKIAEIVKGMTVGCQMAGMALLGGETAEHPGLMPVDEYDLAGFAVGVVDEEKIISGTSVSEGDSLVGIASSGIHSNGFSLIRQLFAMDAASLHKEYAVLGKSLGEALLEPTKIYVKTLKAVCDSGVTIKGCSHITGGGWVENIKRMWDSPVLCATLDKRSYPLPPLFKLIQETGGLSEETMYSTFNMGLGMILAVAKEEAEQTLAAIKKSGETAWLVGQISAARETNVAPSFDKDMICLQ